MSLFSRWAIAPALLLAALPSMASNDELRGDQLIGAVLHNNPKLQAYCAPLEIEHSPLKIKVCSYENFEALPATTAPLSLFASDFSITDPAKFFEELKKFSNLQELKFNYNQLGPRGFRHLAGYIRSSKLLKSLHIQSSDIGLGDEKDRHAWTGARAQMILDAIQENPTITSLSIYDNLPEGFGKNIATFLENTPSLETLRMGKFFLNDKDVTAIRASFHKTGSRKMLNIY